MSFWDSNKCQINIWCVFRTIMTVWKTVLEETNRVGQQRLVGAETYLQDISESAKPLCTAKKQTAKKVRFEGGRRGCSGVMKTDHK